MITQLTKLKSVLEFALNNKYSSFYRLKYQKHILPSNLSKLKLEEFRQLPYLLREEIDKSSPFERLFVPADKIQIVKISSGTTTNSPLVVFLDEADSITRKIHLDILRYSKIKNLLYLLNPYQLQLRWYVYKEAILKPPLKTIGDINNLSLSARIASVAKIDGIETSPSLLYFFTPHLKSSYNLAKISFITLTGEYTSELRLAYFKKNFPNAYFNFYCGAAETNTFGYRCKFLSKRPARYYHFFPSFYPEVVEGELVLTTLKKSAFPLIRYRTGSQATLFLERCPCGQDLIFEFLGRIARDFVKLSGGVIHPKLLEQALLKLKSLIEPDFQLHVFELVHQNKILPLLELKLISKVRFLSKKDKEVLKKQIQKIVSDSLFLSPTVNLSKLVEEGIFLPLKISFVDKNLIASEGKDSLIISHIK
ncbi:hypothetical protein HYS93_00465 [Candidatus Daviesbacteria bacterium]|nr:hypothetical protein [Candidatus Daviesbacteria bacterium]